MHLWVLSVCVCVCNVSVCASTCWGGDDEYKDSQGEPKGKLLTGKATVTAKNKLVGEGRKKKKVVQNKTSFTVAALAFMTQYWP